MKKFLKLSGWILCAALILGVSSGRVFARLTGTDPGTDVFCIGVDGAELCADASGNWLPTTDNDATLGTSSLRFATAYILDITVGDDLTVADDLTVTDVATVTNDAVVTSSLTVGGAIIDQQSGPLIVVGPASQTIGAGGIIKDDACGGLKKITAAGAVTTDTTNSFTAPSAKNAGCCMDVANVGAQDITVDENANFTGAGAADVVLGAGDSVRVCSTGASGVWVQIGATGNN